MSKAQKEKVSYVRMTPELASRVIAFAEIHFPGTQRKMSEAYRRLVEFALENFNGVKSTTEQVRMNDVMQPVIHRKTMQVSVEQSVSAHEDEALEMLQACQAVKGDRAVAERLLQENFPDLKPRFEELLIQGGFAPAKKIQDVEILPKLQHNDQEED